MLRRLLSRLRLRSPGPEQEGERLEAARLKDARTTDRAYVRFGPRNAIPDTRRDADAG